MAEFREDDFRWLISEKARPYLDRAANSSGELVALASSLRKELSVSRAHLVLRQCELRRRAHVKFARADEMFFTRTLLEQATEQRIASYKASRVSADCPLVDLCCGLGGDLIGWAASGRCCGVDRDPIAVMLAAANCAANGLPTVETVVADASDFDVGEFHAWHIDPDRRPHGRRTTQPVLCEPSPRMIDHLLERQPNAAVKLAPAALVCDAWRERAEIEWIGSRRECRQQLAWFGELARRPGMRRATVVQPDGEFCSIAAASDQDAPTTERIGRYVFEPHAAVLAAQLVNAVCAPHHLFTISSGAGYLTADDPYDDPLVSCFEVMEVLPFDLRRLRATLRERRVGQLEIKVRGVDVDPAKLRPSLLKKSYGENKLSLLIMGPAAKPRAVLARRSLCD